MIELFDSAREVMRRRCMNIDGTLNVDLASYVLGLQTSLNVYAIFSVNDLEDKLWSDIAKLPDSMGISAFIDGAIEFRMRNQLNDVKWRDLKRTIAETCGLRSDTPAGGPVGIYQRTPDVQARGNILGHDWLIFLIFIVMSEPVMTPQEIKAHTSISSKEE